MTERSARTRSTFRVGSVLGRSISIWFRNIVPFTLLIIIVHIPMILYMVYYESIEEPSVDEFRIYSLVLEYAPRILTLVVAGALVYGVFEQLGGRRPGLGACVRVGLARLGPVLLVGLLVGVAWTAPIIIAGLVHEVAILVGIIPAIILLCMFFVAVPAAVVERPGILGAIKRSVELTRGYKGSIFLVNLVIGAMQWGVGVALGVVLVATESSEGAFPWFILATIVLFGGLTATVSAVVYHDLRQVKEGVGLEELQQVFA
ncbi:MAG: hypothetical protein ACYTEG_02840 [Planctomycetota bacterium]|jgi:hypothetical protein